MHSTEGESHAHVHLVSQLDRTRDSRIERESARRDATAELAESLGGKLVELYWTVGPYDIVAIFEAPDDETAAAMQLTVGSRGAVRTTTLRAFHREEIERIIAKTR